MEGAVVQWGACEAPSESGSLSRTLLPAGAGGLIVWGVCRGKRSWSGQWVSSSQWSWTEPVSLVSNLPYAGTWRRLFSCWLMWITVIFAFFDRIIPKWREAVPGARCSSAGPLICWEEAGSVNTSSYLLPSIPGHRVGRLCVDVCVKIQSVYM